MDNQSDMKKQEAHMPLTAEMVRQQLIQRHNQPLSEDDPILMVATMFELFLTEYDAVLQKHQGAIETFMTTSSQYYADKVQQSTDELLSRALQGTISNNMDAMSDCKKAMGDFSSVNRTYAIVSVISCTITICLFLSWFFMRGQ
ncbi:hypothetical protein [Halodesulfovibrio sp.]|jgi:hypothetical protein|uniref:hypothetical protein n=1 Tax=Halodesulfovibrio sp. TaxID=1912772 RepID=UPI0025F6BC17|nr:hypothetical protein [Halodesulfovibrio sp.]MCT4625645.1 hypothetical protein [Halodesulfovibrio sp.]